MSQIWLLLNYLVISDCFGNHGYEGSKGYIFPAKVAKPLKVPNLCHSPNMCMYVCVYMFCMCVEFTTVVWVLLFQQTGYWDNEGQGTASMGRSKHFCR